MQSLTELPEQDRPREKLLLRGAKALSDSELLAIFLRTGTQGRNAVELARDLLNHFGSLVNLLNANLQSFSQIKGLGTAKYAQLQACLELNQRYLLEKVTRGSAIERPEQVKDYLKAKLSGRLNEVFAVLFLDNQHRIIAYEELFFGTINAASVHPRVILQRALSHNASAIILAHNHPSGVAEASNCDVDITATIKQAMALIDVHLLDHLIVASCQVVSLAEQGKV